MGRQLGRFLTTLLILLGLFFVFSPVLTVYAELFQLDISSIFNADVVINGTDTTNTGLDGAGTAYYTQSAYEAACYPDPDPDPQGLADDGYYPSNAFHPNIQLGFSEDNDGDNAYVGQGINSNTGFIDIPDASYSSIHIIAVSTEGNTPVTLTFRYSDNSEVTTGSQSIQDWANDITETSSLYYIDSGMDRSHDNASGCEDLDKFKIFGVKYTANPAKVMTAFRVNYDASGDARRRFVLFGATGENETPDSITNDATDITNTTAQLNGTVNARGTATVTFEYGSTTGYGNSISADQSPLTSTSDSPVSFLLNNLTPNSVYHYRVIGENTVGKTYGEDKTFTTKETPAVVFGSNTNPRNGSTINTPITQITIEFNQSVTTASAEDVENYMLVEKGPNGSFQTDSCIGGVISDDVAIPIIDATYDNSDPFVTSLTFNPLPYGTYRLFICGTTSIENSDGTKLNNGTADALLNFSYLVPTAESLPATGFPKSAKNILPYQPVNKNYEVTDLVLEIPSINVKTRIVNVPIVEGTWDVTWLGNNAGYLTGSAFPTWNGNTVVTGHVWDANNNPGIFSQLRELKYGDRVLIHAWGMAYTYEVRQSDLFFAKNGLAKIFQTEEYDWLTLLTCETYNPLNGEYLFRRSVRAVLVDVK